MSENGRPWQVRIERGVAERLAAMGSAASVYLALAVHADWESGECYPALGTIGEVTDLSERAVRYIVARLEREGLVSRVRRPGEPTLYKLGGATACRTPNEGRKQIAAGGGNGLPGGPATGCRITSSIEQAPKNQHQRERAGKAGSPPEVPGELLTFIDLWNALPEGTVAKGNRARRDPPAKALLSGWSRAHKNPEQRDAFQDVPSIIEAIRGATFCHGQPWFTLPWLFGRNKNGECNINRLLAGAYVGDHSNGNNHRGGVRGSVGPSANGHAEPGRIRSGKPLPITILSNEDPPGGPQAADAPLDR